MPKEIESTYTITVQQRQGQVALLIQDGMGASMSAHFNPSKVDELKEALDKAKEAAQRYRLEHSRFKGAGPEVS